MSMVDDQFTDGLEDEALDASDLTIEEQARAANWRPFAEWRGPPEEWKTAEEYLELIEREFPIAKETARRLTKKTARMERELIEVRQQLANGQREQMEALREMGATMRTADARAYERAKAELLAQRDGAVEAGDVATFKQVEQELIELEKGARPASPPPPPPAPPPAAAVPNAERVILEQWVAENGWFNTDEALKRAMISHHSAVRVAKPNMPLAQQLDLARSRVVQDFPEEFEDDEETNLTASPPPPPPPPARRVPLAVTRPGGTPLGRGQTRTVWDQIEDAGERAAVKTQYERFKVQNNDPEMPASEFITIYLDPHADALELRRQRKKA